jgi:hypothetical protein
MPKLWLEMAGIEPAFQENAPGHIYRLSLSFVFRLRLSEQTQCTTR